MGAKTSAWMRRMSQTAKASRQMRRTAAVIKEKAGSAAIYAVLTGDAHGAGLLEMAKLLREEGIGRFAVSEPSDAAALRKAGFVDEEILMLRSTTDREELAKLLNISENQLSYITNVPAGHGIIRCGGAIIPFENSFPKNTKLYRLMTTKPNEKFL